MIKKIYNFWLKRKTKSYTLIPLFTMTFDYQKYKKYGKKDSCTLHSHPDIAEDEFLKEKFRECVDHVRDTYDLEKFTMI